MMMALGVMGNGRVSLRNEWSHEQQHSNNKGVSVMECVAPFGHPSANGQECECCPGYHGTGCTSRNTCHDRVCLNGGQCDAGRGICMCAEGFLGKNCEVVDCGLHGSYDPFTGTCSCARGWDGYRCDQCATPLQTSLDYICVPGKRSDYVLLQVNRNIAQRMLINAINPLNRPYPAIKPNSQGHDKRHYGCDCRPHDELQRARDMHHSLIAARSTSVAELGEFDEVISDCITNSNLTAQQMQDLNDLWNTCMTQELRGRLGDTWYIVGVIFIVLFIVVLFAWIITCFMWSYNIDSIKQRYNINDDNDDGIDTMSSSSSSVNQSYTKQPRRRRKKTPTRTYR